MGGIIPTWFRRTFKLTKYVWTFKKAYNLHDLENVLVSLICPHGNHHVKVQVKLAMIYKQPTLCLECTSYFISVISLQAVRVARAPKLAVKIGERTFWIRVSPPWLFQVILLFSHHALAVNDSFEGLGLLVGNLSRFNRWSRLLYITLYTLNLVTGNPFSRK